ncbi:hypothetical protein JOB18_046581 [Solea senegalensis]|uniref:Uncharacterized protein n=1 Tax=Solea senegalensis TaxID=28829 RepID=A0AAV6QBT6_SOLSE|nr:hypothetical protein JOB18_046581 [Solea senegalensis]
MASAGATRPSITRPVSHSGSLPLVDASPGAQSPRNRTEPVSVLGSGNHVSAFKDARSHLGGCLHTHTHRLPGFRQTWEDNLVVFPLRHIIHSWKRRRNKKKKKKHPGRSGSGDDEEPRSGIEKAEENTGFITC